MGDAWRRTLERSQADFESLREPRFAALLSAEGSGPVVVGITQQALADAGYGSRLDSWFGVEWLDVSPSAVTIEAFADTDADAWRGWNRFLAAAERAARATLEAPEGLLGELPPPDGAPGWLCLLASVGWLDGTASCRSLSTGEEVLPDGGSPWFSIVPDLAAASVELVDVLLAAEAAPAAEQTPASTASGLERLSAEELKKRIADVRVFVAWKEYLASDDATDKPAFDADWLDATDRRRDRCGWIPQPNREPMMPGSEWHQGIRRTIDRVDKQFRGEGIPPEQRLDHARDYLHQLGEELSARTLAEV